MAYELAYLFECHFTDGTSIQQTLDDLSSVDPARSAFYDVAQRLAEVEVFGLFNDKHTVAVDLRDGHFELDGVPFSVHNGDELPFEAVRRLIFFRRHRHTVAATDFEAASHEVEYHIGWQTTVNGKNFQRTIAVS